MLEPSVLKSFSQWRQGEVLMDPAEGRQAGLTSGHRQTLQEDVTPEPVGAGLHIPSVSAAIPPQWREQMTKV